MTILSWSDDGNPKNTVSEKSNSISTRDLRLTLELYQSPFNWNIPTIDEPIETYIKNQKEKCEVNEEEHQFQWSRFVTHLALSYELCEKMKDYTQALEHISWCQGHWNDIHLERKEPLFVGLREVLAHVIFATKANILLAAGKFDLAQKEVNLLSNYPYGDVKHLSSTKNRAGLHGLKAALYLQYRSDECERALEAAKEARKLDPDQAEWWFIVGNILCRMRRLRMVKEDIISTEEMEAIEKAFALQKDAAYTVRLATLYGEYSTNLFRMRMCDKARTYAFKAVTRYREALQIRPSCADLKARVAHGMLRIRYPEAVDFPFTKNLLDELVKTGPNRMMAYKDLGMYYSRYEKDIEKAISNYQKAYELGGVSSIIYLAELKWKNGLWEQIMADVEGGLTRHQTNNEQAMLYSYLGACHVVMHDEWQSAISCFKNALELDPTARYMEEFRDFKGKFVNLLAIITNHLHFRAADENQDIIKSFLDYVAQKKPQTVDSWRKYDFFNWKKELEEHKVLRTSNSNTPTNSVEDDLANKQNVCIDANQGPLGIISTQMAELIKSVNSLSTNLATKEEVNSIVADVELMKEEVNDIEEKVEALEPRVMDAETRLEQLEAKMERLEKRALGTPSLEELIGEVNDRARRANNIIFHNLPEDVDEPLEMRIAHDKSLILKVSRATNYDLDTSKIKFRRIGKPTRGKFRPLIVIFKTAEETKSFFENVSVDSIKDFDPALVNIGVTKDKTYRERQHVRSLMEELEQRTSRGERNLTIKFKNGVREIVGKH